MILCPLILALYGCTDSEQEKEIQEQKQRDVQQSKLEQKELPKELRENPAATPEEEPTPEPSPEPQVVDVYKVGNGPKCFCHHQSECGTDFWQCDNEIIYECTHNVQYRHDQVETTSDVPSCN